LTENQILILLVSSCVLLGELLNLSAPQLPHLQHECY
jgi:hypothetical protein